MCFGDVATAPLAMALPRTRTAHLKCAQSCWGCCTHKQAQTGRDMCWHRGMHAHPGFTFAHLCTCSHIHMAWGEFKCMCVHAQTTGFAPPETLTWLLQATILGVGRSCMGCPAAATPSRGFQALMEPCLPPTHHTAPRWHLISRRAGGWPPPPLGRELRLTSAGKHHHSRAMQESPVSLSLLGPSRSRAHLSSSACSQHQCKLSETERAKIPCQ